MSRLRRIFPQEIRYTYRITVVLILIIYNLIFEYLMVLENQLKNANVITAIYWATTTIATVGYGDIVFTFLAGRLFFP